MPLDLQSLEVFLVLADTLHFGRAAKQVHLSQSAFSQRIMRFEEEIGVKLLQRSSRRVRLTAAGEALVKHGRSLVDEAHSTVSLVHRAAAGEIGSVRFAFVGSATTMGMPERLRRVRKSLPEVALILEEVPAQLQVERILQGSIDVGLMRTLGTVAQPLSATLFVEEPYWLAIPEDHRLAQHDAVGVEDLQSESLLFFPRRYQPMVYDRWLAVFSAHGVAPTLTQEIRTTQLEQALVAAGYALALCPMSTHRESRPGIAYRPLVGDDLPTVRLDLVWDPARIDESGQRFVEAMTTLSP